MPINLKDDRAQRADFIVYADGACSGNPGPGGYAYRIETPEAKCAAFEFPHAPIPLEHAGRSPETTNNIMELEGAIGALRALDELWAINAPEPETIVALRLDSEYVLRGMFDWIQGWKSRGWRTAAKKPVKNQSYWEALDRLAERLRMRGVTLVPDWVKGHSGEAGNEIVDRMAVEARDAARAIAREDAEIAAAHALVEQSPTFGGASDAFDTPAAQAREVPSQAQLDALAALVSAHANGVIDAGELHAKIRTRARELGLA